MAVQQGEDLRPPRRCRNDKKPGGSLSA